MKKWLGLALTALLFLTACGEDAPTRPNEFVPLSSITVSSPLVSIAPGTSVPLTATGDFSGAFTRDVTGEATWTPQDPTILTPVEGNPSRFRALSVGATTVNATVEGITGSVRIEVPDITIQSLSLPATAEVTRGSSVPLTATGVFSGAIQDISFDVDWSSSDITVAMVDARGGVTGVKNGTATITATFVGGKSAATTVTVTEPVLQSVTVTPDPVTLIRGATRTFTLTGNYNNGTTAPLTTGVTWESSVVGVATIASDGTATAVSLGTTVITGRVGTLSDTANLTVAAPTSIEISTASGNLRVGAEVTFTATAAFGQETLDVTAQADWRSTVPSVAVPVSGRRGAFTLESAGTATIEATMNGVTGRRTITVTNGG